MIRARLRLLFCLSVALLYLVLFIAADGLRFPLLWDEHSFWTTSLSFSQNLLPTVEQLRSYGQLNTPLPFLIFGYLEYFFEGGIFAGRLLNFILSVIIVCLIGIPKCRGDWYSILCVCGLLLFPYYLFTSLVLYTDIIAAFFVFLGFWFYSRNRHILSGICFACAIASRQTTLAFPVAVAIFELINSLRNGFRSNIRWLAPTIAAASILGWILLFGGLIPEATTTASTITIIPTEVAQEPYNVSWLFPRRGFYFLACIGLYFVIPESLLFFRWSNLSNLLTRKSGYIAFVLLSIITIYSYLQPKGLELLVKFQGLGLLKKALLVLPNDFWKIALLYFLVLLVCIRFFRFDLAFWVILMNLGILMRGYPWDKYALPLLVVLWYLKSQDSPGKTCFKTKAQLLRRASNS